MNQQRSDTEALPMRHPERWLAVLRLTVGLWFLKSLFTKVSVALVGGVIPLPVASERWIATMPKLITKYAAENPFRRTRRSCSERSFRATRTHISRRLAKRPSASRSRWGFSPRSVRCSARSRSSCMVSPYST